MSGANQKMRTRVSLGKTLNIGNYESLRIDVSHEYGYDQHSFPEVCDSIYRQVCEKFAEKLEDIRKRFS